MVKMIRSPAPPQTATGMTQFGSTVGGMVGRVVVGGVVAMRWDDSPKHYEQLYITTQVLLPRAFLYLKKMHKCSE